jgi:hypothetical protein
MEDVVLVYGHVVYFTAIWYNFWPFRMFYGYLGYFFRFWYVVLRKIWQPWSRNSGLSVNVSPLFSNLFNVIFFSILGFLGQSKRLHLDPFKMLKMKLKIFLTDSL